MLHIDAPGVGHEPFPGHRLRQRLGQGGRGEVWEADVAGGGRVAVKFMATSGSLLDVREIRAIQAVRTLQHPNLLRIDSVWSKPGYLVCSMELAEGSLQDLVEAHLETLRTPMPTAQVCSYLKQVAGALDFLNARQHLIDGQRVGVQHCDVKPSNILLFGETVKLCDFGLATLTATRLQAHDHMGTPNYAAPEIFHYHLSDQSDQYSLAVSYCALRSGRLPFPDTNSFDPTWLRHRPNPDLSGLSADEQSVIARALDPTPQNRWPTCSDLMTRLTAATRAR
jgi:serine/threonine protein kinase